MPLLYHNLAVDIFVISPYYIVTSPSSPPIILLHPPPPPIILLHPPTPLLYYYIPLPPSRGELDTGELFDWFSTYSNTLFCG